MRIAVLGPLEVTTEELVPVPVAGAKERLLLAVLAASAPGVVSIDALAETLWDGRPPASARKTLQSHMVRLRSALEPHRAQGSTGRYVLRRGTGYALAVGREDLDALQVVDLTARGRAQQAAGDAREAVTTLTAALDMWRGEPYADWPDLAFARRERGRLLEVRNAAEVIRIEALLALGRHSDVLPQLERLVADEPLREDWWRLQMLALYRAGRQADALAAARRARRWVSEELGTDPGPELQAMEAAVLAHDPALDLHAPPTGATLDVPPATTSVERTAEPPCPFKGLATYQVADAALFSGRRLLVAGLVARLVDASLLVVSGPSGAGKSSAVRAGLVPALADGAVPGSDAWRPVIVAPGRRPVDVLASLTGDPAPAEQVLLVIDQFEEVWGPGVETAERSAFLDAVLGLIDDGIVVRCVAVIRGDHVGRLAEHAAFTERMGATLVLVPALSDPELREIVREPAGVVGLSVEGELLDAVVADVLGRPGALPLLSAALVGTWERRRDRCLTLAGYLSVGGVAGAVTRTAEAAYGVLDDDSRATARRLLVRLADTDEGGALVRRPLSLADLELEEEHAAGRRHVVDVFVERRLLAVDGDRLEVAHEALFTAWPRLAGWLEDDAAGRAVRRHLAPAAREWADTGRTDEELYRGARLAAALDWLAAREEDTSPLEREFLTASRSRAEAELVEARDRTRRTRRLAAGLAAALVVALVAAGLAVRSERAVQHGVLVAEASRLAAQSRTVKEIDLAMSLAAQGFRVADTPESREALRAAVTAHRRALRVVPLSELARSESLGDHGEAFFIIDHGADLLRWRVPAESSPQRLGRLPEIWTQRRVIDASPTDDRLAAAGSSREGPWVRVVDARLNERLLLSGQQVGGDPLALRFTADGRLLDVLVATPSAAGAAIAWRVVQVDPESGTPRETGTAGTLPAGGRVSAAMSDDAGTAVLWTDQQAAAPTLVDLASGQQVPLRLGEREGTVMTYRALASGAAQLWDDGAVVLYDREGRVGQILDAHRLNLAHGPVRDVVLQGEWAATVGDGAAVYRWSVDPVTGLWERPQYLAGHGGHVREAHLDPLGERLITVAPGDGMILWDFSAAAGSDARDPAVTDTQGWLQAACDAAGRDLTMIEWRRYVPESPWRPTCSDL